MSDFRDEKYGKGGMAAAPIIAGKYGKTNITTYANPPDPTEMFRNSYRKQENMINTNIFTDGNNVIPKKSSGNDLILPTIGSMPDRSYLYTQRQTKNEMAGSGSEKMSDIILPTTGSMSDRSYLYTPKQVQSLMAGSGSENMSDIILPSTGAMPDRSYLYTPKQVRSLMAGSGSENMSDIILPTTGSMSDRGFLYTPKQTSKLMAGSGSEGLGKLKETMMSHIQRYRHKLLEGMSGIIPLVPESERMTDKLYLKEAMGEPLVYPYDTYDIPRLNKPENTQLRHENFCGCSTCMYKKRMANCVGTNRKLNVMSITMLLILISVILVLFSKINKGRFS